MAKCDGPNCGEDVVWAETANGKRQPFNREPDPKGNRVLLGRGPDRPPLAIRADALDPDDIHEDGYTLSDLEACHYMPHHATCADVDQFRRPRS